MDDSSRGPSYKGFFANFTSLHRAGYSNVVAFTYYFVDQFLFNGYADTPGRSGTMVDIDTIIPDTG
jgi:hypothetical protein